MHRLLWHSKNGIYFIRLRFCQAQVLSSSGFVKLRFCQAQILSGSDFVRLRFCHNSTRLHADTCMPSLAQVKQGHTSCKCGAQRHILVPCGLEMPLNLVFGCALIQRATARTCHTILLATFDASHLRQPPLGRFDLGGLA